METFVITLKAKPGQEDKVADFYVKQQSEYDNAKGFQSRQILQAKPGTMGDAVKKIYSAEELAKHPEPHAKGPVSVQFVIVEHWDSVDDRMIFSKNRDKTLDVQLFPLLEPAHTHEFYKEL